MTTPSAPLPTRELERGTPPFEPTVVEELLKLFGKAARAHQLYLPNNPVYKSAHDALRAGFTPVWSETDELLLSFMGRARPESSKTADAFGLSTAL